VLGVLGVIAVVLLVVLTSDDGDGSLAAPSTTDPAEPVTTRRPDTPETTEPSPDTTAPDDSDEAAVAGDVSALDVVEDGFSTYAGSIGDTTNGSFGFLVENTGDATIVGAPLSVAIRDEAGGVIETTNFTVGVIRPGETLGYGAELIQHPTDGIGEIDVQVGESVATYEVPAEGTLTVSDIDTTGDDHRVTTTFAVSSTYGEQVDYAEPHAIYRDASGRIIGGGNGILDFIPPGGQQTGQVDILAPIPNIATTEVYVDPGPFY
jgi:hypothetical protein